MTKTLKFSLLVALAMVLVAIPACGGGAAPTPTTKPAAPAPTSPPAATKAAAPAATTAPAAPAATKPAAPAPTTAPAAATGDVAAGKAIFDQNCNGCHPGGDKGVGSQIKGRSLPADRIRSQVRNGGGAMPAFPSSRISDQQLNDLVAFVVSLK